jgi:hypothetical protein
MSGVTRVVYVPISVMLEVTQPTRPAMDRQPVGLRHADPQTPRVHRPLGAVQQLQPLTDLVDRQLGGLGDVDSVSMLNH